MNTIDISPTKTIVKLELCEAQLSVLERGHHLAEGKVFLCSSDQSRWHDHHLRGSNGFENGMSAYPKIPWVFSLCPHWWFAIFRVSLCSDKPHVVLHLWRKRLRFHPSEMVRNNPSRFSWETLWKFMIQSIAKKWFKKYGEIIYCNVLYICIPI